jgi:mannosyltransferase OCH1-like enzyme
MKLFQYWDTPTPPSEIAQWIDECRERNPEFEHVLLNEATADDFIAKHYGPRELRAFRSCAVPAMQADLIRLCLIDTMGGIYLDADSRCLRPLSELIARAPYALMWTSMGGLNNSFLMFRQPHHVFIRLCLALAVDNIEGRRFKNVPVAAGPGLFTTLRELIDPACAEQRPSPQAMADWESAVSKFFGPTLNLEVTMEATKAELVELRELARPLVAHTPDLVSAFRCVTLIDTLETLPWIGTQQPAYKQTDRHWLLWKGDIYR